MPKSMEGVMKEYKQGKLHSGSKHGPKVKNRKQAIAIGMSEQRSMHGSGAFSKAEMDRGYKVECSSTELHAMDPDRMHNMQEWTMANRRNGTHMGSNGRRNLHRLED